jgi:response regulator RpfG family c-di-GMP phosphodiesterase
MGKSRVLFVDDEIAVLHTIERLLHGRRAEWDMCFVRSAEEALREVGCAGCDAVVADLNMPGRTGFDLLSALRESDKTRDIPVIILTGDNDIALRHRALAAGATDLLSKPVILEDLIVRLESALRLKSSHDELRALNATLEQRVRERTLELEKSRLDIIWRLAKPAEYREDSSGNHVERVGHMCRAVAEALGSPPEFVEMIFLTSPLHDVGKISIPDSILLKAEGELTADERRIVEAHCAIGADILKREPRGMETFLKWHGAAENSELMRSDQPLLAMAASIAQSHHEWWDGTGYPQRLARESIPLEAQIVAVVDAYDSMRSQRVARNGRTDEQTLEVMRCEVGKHFSPAVFAAFEKSLGEIREIWAQCQEPQAAPVPEAAGQRRVLFVDDEPNVLQGLERMLHPLRHEWEMAFVESGAEALDLLARQTFDVVVSDMRMPGMNGAELLSEVRKRCPQTVRIVLSGHSNRDMILQSVDAAHQYLAKPCDAQALKATVMRACALRDILGDPGLKTLVSQLRTLPSLPTLYAQVVEELNSPEASMHRVGAIISKDVGMTAKILQLVNSAFFGLPRHVANPAQAAALLGLETVKALVLSVEVFSQLDLSALPELSMDELLEHSVRAGSAAKAIAQSEKQEAKVVDDAFMAGILHDAGKLILAANSPREYQRALSMAAKRGVALCEAEREVFGATHAEVGAYLMGLWGLPDPIVEALAFHHSPSKSMAQTFTLLTAVHVANALLHEADGEHDGVTRGGVDLNYLAAIGLTDRLPSWRTAMGSVLAGGGQ